MITNSGIGTRQAVTNTSRPRSIKSDIKNNGAIRCTISMTENGQKGISPGV
jgi:hypothetical protein